MSDVKQWVLTDVAQGTWVEGIELDGEALGISGARVCKRVLHGGLSDGVDVIEVDNGALSFTVVPTRGMGVWQGRYGDCFIGWRSPVRGPVNPAFVDLGDLGGLGWLAGFDECIVRCGLASHGAPGTDVVPNNNGDPTEIELTLHGRIANIPAHYVAVEADPAAGEIRVVGAVDESMLFFPQLRLETTIATTAGASGWTMREGVTNLRSVASEMELLYHCNFGGPFLDAGARLCVPSTELVPFNARAAEDAVRWAEYVAPTPGFVEQCYLHVPRGDADGQTVALLRNATGDRAVAVRFNVREMPCLTQWKNCGAEADGYVTGLEPGTSYPNPRAFERRHGRVVKLEPGERYPVTLSVEVHDRADMVAAVEAEIAVLQGEIAPWVHEQPRNEYSGG